MTSDKAAVVDWRKRTLDLKTEFLQSHIANIFSVMQLIPLDLQGFLRICETVPKCGHVLSLMAAFHHPAT